MDKALNETLAKYLDQPENEFFQLELTEYLTGNPESVNEVREYICDHIALLEIYGESSEKLIDGLNNIIAFKPADEEDFVSSVEKKISRKKPKTVINISDINTRRVKRPKKKKSKSALPIVISLTSIAAILTFIFIFSSGPAPQNYYLSVKDSSGDIEVKRADKISKISKGEEVKKGDILISGNSESVILSSKDGNEIRLNGEGELEVEELDTFKLNKGEAYVTAKKVLTLKTEFSQISASNSEYLANSSPKETRVHCKTGAVKIVDSLTKRFQLLEIDEIYTSADRSSYLYRLELVGLGKERKAVPFIESLEPGSSFKLGEIPTKDLNFIVHLWNKGEVVKKGVALQMTISGPRDYVIDFRGSINTRVESSYPYCFSPDDLGLMPNEGWKPAKGKHTFRIDVMSKGKQVIQSFSVDFEVK